MIGSARVFTTDQDLTLQTDALTKAGCKKLFTDKVIGAKADRPGLAGALRFARAGDCLMVWKLDRLGFISLAADVLVRKANLRSLKDGFDTPTASGRLLALVSSQNAEQRRALLAGEQLSSRHVIPRPTRAHSDCGQDGVGRRNLWTGLEARLA